MFFPHRPFTGNGNNHMQLQCPLCGNTWVHIELADAVCDETTDDYTSPGGTRGEWISIPAWCEADHEWDIVLGFHKGETFVDVTQRKDAKERLQELNKAHQDVIARQRLQIRHLNTMAREASEKAA
jgi:hypothetical protein